MKSYFLRIVSVLFLTGAVIAVAVFWIQKNTKQNKKLSASFLSSFADKDSDGDGLNDNMESIYGTDFNKSDTDGDGFLDGEEVISGYDPLKPAPNDKLNTKYTIIPRPAAGSIKNLNYTNDLIEKLTEKIVGEEILPRKDNEIVTLENPSSIEEALSAAVQRSYQEFTPPQIPSDQIIINDDNSEDSIKLYGQKMSACLTPITQVSSIDIDEGKITFDNLVVLCENTAINMKKISVPSDLAELHKKHISLLIIQTNVIKAVADIQNDPLKANIALSQLGTIRKLSEEVLNDIFKNIKSHIHIQG
ncbi:MAG: hypothetical protein V1698_01940 [bacterium]